VCRGVSSGLVEEWDASIELMERLLPTYFEGFYANISRGTCSASHNVLPFSFGPLLLLLLLPPPPALLLLLSFHSRCS